MFDQQLDIAAQMILRWDRLGPDNVVIAGDDFTKYVGLYLLLLFI